MISLNRLTQRMFPFFKKKPKQSKLHEFSTNFDVDAVRPFLERIQPLMASGFSSGEIERVCQLIATLSHGQELMLEFQVRYAGEDTPLQIRVFMDDLAAPDVYFYSSTALAQTIAATCERFMAEQEV